MADKKKINIFLLILNIVSFIIVFTLVVSLVLLMLFMQFNAPVKESIPAAYYTEHDGVSFQEEGFFIIEIRRGENAQSIGMRLERAGLISSRHFWYLLCRFGNEFLKSGTYRIDYPSSQLAVYRILTSGRQMLHRVTIPEGVTLKKMSEIIENAGICSAEDFLESARDPQILNRYMIPNETIEGYLFPDTYFFPADYPASLIVTKMADNFFNRLKNITPDAENMNPYDLNRLVIVSSIVEREYRLAEEAPLMAGVFFNRLRIGMALQSCATVVYVITEIEGKRHPSVLYNEDLEIKSPYNTYLNPGLPPGPICAPGEVALRSVFYPQESNYLYFRLTDPVSGRHYFSRTFDEHIMAGQLVPKAGY